LSRPFEPALTSAFVYFYVTANFREVRAMMYGFGDDREPRADSIKLMEEFVLEYVTGLVGKATDVAAMQRRDRPDVTDIKFVIRKNRRQLNRVRYLLEMKAVINKATKVDAEEVAHAAPGAGGETADISAVAIPRL
jgi:Transcription initiation factor IID, 18kD subunit